MENQIKNKPVKDSDGNTAAIIWAKGGFWLLFFLGLGSCCTMVKHSDREPLIKIITQEPTSQHDRVHN